MLNQSSRIAKDLKELMIFQSKTFVNSSKISLKLGSLKIKPIKRIIATIESGISQIQLDAFMFHAKK